MTIDWMQVKKDTLWHYEDLLRKMLEVVNYSFVREHYNHTMVEAVSYSEKVRRGYVQNGKEAAFIGEITRHFRTLADIGIIDYRQLLLQVDTKPKCEAFLKKTGFGFEALIQVLNYLFRWVLPFKCPVKELVDIMAKRDLDYLDLLKRQKIRSNLDVLESFRTERSRLGFSKATAVSRF